MTLATEFDPSDKHRNNPYDLFARMRHEEPVSYDEKTGIYLVTRYSTIEYVTAHTELFSSSGANPINVKIQPEPLRTILQDIDWFAPPVLELDGEHHRVSRSVWNSYLHGKVVAQLSDGIQEQARHYASQIRTGETVDLHTEFIEPYVTSCVGKVLMNLPDDEYEKSQEQADDIVAWSTPWLPMDDRIEAAQRTAKVMTGDGDGNWYRTWYQRLRKEEMKPNLLSMAAHHSPYDQFLFFALSWIPSVRTTVAGLLNAIYHVHSTAMWQSMKDPKLASAAWEESLRIDAPHRGLARTVTADTVLEGTQLRKGDTMLLLFGAANRDEQKFTDPDRFVLNRSNVRDHFAFGNGSHVCVGRHLANVEAKTALTELATTFPTMRLASGVSELEYEAGLFFRIPSQLPVIA